MSVQVRPIREDEFDRFIALQQEAFAGDRSPEGIARERRKFLPEWGLATFDQGEMVACLSILPFAMRVDGHGVPLGGISSVASLPERRRQGHVGALLRGALATMRDRGQALSALYTPHHPLYHRFGWGLASRRLEYRFACKDVDLSVPPPQEGRVRRVDRTAIPQLDAVYRRWAEGRTGPMDRFPLAWEEGTLHTLSGDPHDVAVWEGDGGSWDGYVVYSAWNPGREYQGQRLWVQELAACTPQAYQGLVRFLLHHDLVTNASWIAPPDDPFLATVVDPGRVKVVHRRGFMLRLVDVRAALAARPYPADGDLVLAVRDAAAPWNEGRWRLEVRDGLGHVYPSQAEPDLSLDVAVLAPIYDGHLSASAAALAGLLQASSAEALSRADSLFATRTPPFTFDTF